MEKFPLLTRDEHLANYRRNRDFLGRLSCDRDPEWVAVVAFYAAVHLVDALPGGDLPRLGTGHRARGEFVKGHHPGVLSDYSALLRASMLSRYESQTTFSTAYSNNAVQDEQVDICLVSIEIYARSLDVI